MTRKTHPTFVDPKTGIELDAGRFEEWGPKVERPAVSCTGCSLCQARNAKEAVRT